MQCKSIGQGNVGWNMDSTKQKFPQYPGYVIFKAFPDKSDIKFSQLFFCNKFIQTECQIFTPVIDFKSKIKPIATNPPKFVTEMNSSLFERIGGVIDYNFGKINGVFKSGWVLLFNIDGRPKYCVTESELSDEVRHERQLITNSYSEHYFSANLR